MANSAAMIRQIGKQMGLTEAQIRMMIATAKVESSLRPDAVGDGGHSFGLFQHNRFGAGGENAEKYKDPVLSIRERARWFRDRNITTPEGAYNLQRPADRDSYIRKLSAALQGGASELNAPVQSSLGLGAELPGLPSADASPYQSRVSGLQSARERLGVSEQSEEKKQGVDLRGRTNALRDQLSAYKQPAPEIIGPVADAAPAVAGVEGGGHKNILKLGQQFGLRIDGPNQTTGGKHAPGSHHYSGNAVDFGDAKNSPEQLRQLAIWARKNRHRIKELFYDPLGWYIKDGKIIKGSIGGHGDHLHIAM